MRRWNDILEYCMKTYNNGNMKAYDDTDRYSDKNKFAITVEISNNGFYDYVHVFMYI